MNHRSLALLLALGLGGCQVVPPARLPARRPISYEVRQRFELAAPEQPSVLQPVHVLGASPAADAEGVDAPAASIELDDVLHSVERHFPLVLAAREEVRAAEGRLQAAQGGFDTRVSGKGKSKLDGFYDTDQVDLGFEQATTLWGAEFSGGYRLGRGNFAIYDGGDLTNEGGELRIGARLPLLQGRVIDPRRVAVWTARLELERTDPIVLSARLQAMIDATGAYWDWVGAGRRREIALRLLSLAEDRMDQVELAVDEGLLAPINLTENQRLIVDRRVSLLRAERKLQETAIKLSLFWRDAEGRPAVPTDEALPYEFPGARPAEEVLVPGDVELALGQRPEVRSFELLERSLELGRDLARNALLPKLDVGLAASQDVGAEVSDPDDKSDLNLEAFISLEVPLQRRKAKGKLREVEAKRVQLRQKARFVQEKVAAEVQDARSALTQSWLRIAEARKNVRLANELAQAERLKLQEGESDLLRVNLREQQAAASAAVFVDVLRSYFQAQAVYRAVLGIPYEQ